MRGGISYPTLLWLLPDGISCYLPEISWYKELFLAPSRHCLHGMRTRFVPLYTRAYFASISFSFVVVDFASVLMFIQTSDWAVLRCFQFVLYILCILTPLFTFLDRLKVNTLSPTPKDANNSHSSQASDFDWSFKVSIGTQRVTEGRKNKGNTNICSSALTK